MCIYLMSIFAIMIVVQLQKISIPTQRKVNRNPGGVGGLFLKLKFRGRGFKLKEPSARGLWVFYGTMLREFIERQCFVFFYFLVLVVQLLLMPRIHLCLSRYIYYQPWFSV